MVVVVNARNMRNGWGVNDGGYSLQTAQALGYLNTRWVRNDSESALHNGSLQALQNYLVSAGVADPNLRFQVIVTDYYQSIGSDNWNATQGYLNSLISVAGPNGVGVIHALEGGNEMGTFEGNGSVTPNGTTQIMAGDQVNGAADGATQAAFVQWCQALRTFKNAHTAFANVEILSPTVLDFTGNNGNYPTALNVKNYVDYGCFHYYHNTTGGTGGQPSGAGSTDDFSDMYAGMANGMSGGAGGLGMCQSECGPQATSQGGGYALDGVSGAWTMLAQMCDHFVMGGHRLMIYTLFDNNNYNFGMFLNSDPNSPKPIAMAMRNLTTLMSLGNNYALSTNFTDTASFTPAYTGTGFSVTGLTQAGKAGSSMILPKSDGSTMIAVWREPQADDGTNAQTSQVPAGNTVTVNLGSTQNWKVWDPMGGSGGNTTAVSAAPTVVKSGSGSSLSLTLYSVPLFIELAATQVASFSPPTVTSVPSPSPFSTTSLGHILVA